MIAWGRTGQNEGVARPSNVWISDKAEPAIAGNGINFGINYSLDIEKDIDQILKQDMAVSDDDPFRRI